MKKWQMIFYSVICLSGCTNSPNSLHTFTNQLGLVNNNNYIPQAQVKFALPNNWETDVVRFKSLGIKQAPAPKGTYSESNKETDNNPILSTGVKDSSD